MRRRHSDVMLAGLMVVGAWSAVALPVRVYLAFDLTVMSAVCVAAAFVAAQVARRMLPALDIAQTTVAAAIAIMVSFGLRNEYLGTSFEPIALIPFSGIVVGALAGAWTSRGRAESVRRWWRVLGAGFATFGASAIGALVSLVLGGTDILGAGLGACAGSFLVTMWTPAQGQHCAAGFSLVLAITVLGGAAHEDVGAIIGGMLGAFVIGGIVGAIGGRLGECVRREPAAEVPEAKVR